MENICNFSSSHLLYYIKVINLSEISGWINCQGWELSRGKIEQIKSSKMIRMKQYKKLEDFEIIAKVLDGEVALYEIIVRRYNPYLFKIGRSYGFMHHDTEDIMQDAFISAYLNLSKFQHRSSFKTWLVKIMLNYCYQRKQKFSYKNEFASDTIEENNATPMFSHNGSQTSKTVMNNELKRVLENSLVEIPEDYRMVFTLRELNAMSIRETAEALDISESNVKIRLKRAKSMLRTEIQKTYSPEEIFEFNLIYCNRIVENVFKKLEPGKNLNATLRFQDLQKKFFSWFNWRSEKPSSN